MERFEQESPLLLPLVGKYVCFFAFSVLFFTVPPLSGLLWQVMFADGDELWQAIPYWAGLVVCAACAFATGLLFVYRRPVFGTLLMLGCLMIVGALIPDR
jgi:hypothetical protein